MSERQTPEKDPPQNYADTIRAYVEEQARRNHEVIEQACEAALQGGRYGVRWWPNGDGTVTAQVHPSVPYGTIHEHRTRPGETRVTPPAKHGDA